MKTIKPDTHYFVNCQNWYLRERSAPPAVKDERTRRYFELEEHTDEKGFTGEVLVEKDYPITSDYVSSFAASSDYHSDPVGAINRAPVRRNLGDITALQESLNLDYDTARHVYNEFLRARAAQVGKKDSISAPNPVNNGGDNNA